MLHHSLFSGDLTSMAAQQQDEESTTQLLNLPEVCIEHALEWLSFRERRRYFLCGRVLWTRQRGVYETTLRMLSLASVPPAPTLNSLTNLTSLDIGSYATDDFLHSLSSETALPNLRHLFMARALKVTDNGLELLTQNSVRCRMLQTIDITYCRKTTYQGTFVLRDRLKSLCLLRRLPAWLQGNFETPFENDHLHTYWPDGTFSFDRRSPAIGFVSDLFEWNDSQGCVGNKIRYTDINESNLAEVWPPWARMAYRPGVSLRRLPNEHAVLVAQRMHGLYPPFECPKLDDAELVPLGETRFLNRAGNFLDINHNEDERYTMINHIPVKPLKSIMPPPEIVERNRAWLDSIRETRERNELEHNVLQNVLGANPHLISPEYRLHLALQGDTTDWARFLERI